MTKNIDQKQVLSTENIGIDKVQGVQFLKTFAKKKLLKFSNEFQIDNLQVTNTKKLYKEIEQVEAITKLKQEYDKASTLAQEYINAYLA